MTHEEIRGVLARREPWNAVQRTVTRGEPMASSPDWSHAIATFCDEQARTLAQALVAAPRLSEADRASLARALLALAQIARAWSPFLRVAVEDTRAVAVEMTIETLAEHGKRLYALAGL